MSTGSLTLAQIADLLDMVEVRCSKFDRRGRYRITTLIERYGADYPRAGSPGNALGRLREARCGGL